jgi:hypothetical protein
MKLIRNIIAFILLAIGLNGCFENPNYPVVPQIEILNDDIYFGKATEPDDFDSIVLSLKFKDGDGDIGISTEDNGAFKYALKYYYRTGIENNIVNYKFKRANPNFEIDLGDGTTPKPLSSYDFVPPYSCTNWEIVRNAGNVITDTLFIIYNDNHYNIFVDFYTKTNGTFKKYVIEEEFFYPFCDRTFGRGRLPILSKNLGSPTPLDGKITWALNSRLFELIFSIKTLKMRIYIQDRALNKSNVVESKEFTLQTVIR